MTIDLTRIDAIDVHVHVEASVSTPAADRVHPVFGVQLPTVPELAELYRGLKMAAVVFAVDAPESLGHRVSNEEVAEQAALADDVLIPFGSIDPTRRTDAAAMARRLVNDHGIRGFKFHPATQGFFTNDPVVYPLYEALESLGVPALFHTGQVGGGAGARLKYCDPIFLDDVAVDFPGLKIIMAHPSYPWQDVALSIATTRPNAYIDLSGWSPRYFSPQLIQQSNTLLKDKVMFGSDYPVIHPERWLADFAQADFRDAVRPAILKGTAANVLGLT
ncbi:4-hydroxyphenyl-beta-ketoacyl-CoA hydrolase [Microbacterium faecale]|uniref:4-hydroxyphenyl-beta-ketoacyl-CoA hydrolase n=1 Tax=Microbacterium faecale TaxID=1804630 RepID=A0A916Y088_9MICO|nr:amidohydrolase family protein [Microbacterium faecale]GGD24611.1 4-hydroxyphenyl-beta-ketoacyl-CoA hydrolase [Microbacterium faecale]